jgi:AcrR family transcriptional regulator
VKLVYFFSMAHEILDLEKARHSPHVARKRRARILHILHVALEIAHDEGRDGLTLKHVADRLGLTTAALYRYFSSKDALIAELQRAVISALAATTRDRAETADAFARKAGLSQPERALLGVSVSAFAFEAFSRTAPMEFGILSMDLSAPEFTLPDREAALVFETAWSALSDLAERLRAAERVGALAPGDASERAVALWASLQGIVQTRKFARSGPDRIDPTRIARGLVPSLLVGWGADPAIVARAVDITHVQGFTERPETTFDFLERVLDLERAFD